MRQNTVLNITILQDNSNSWIGPWVEKLHAELVQLGHDVVICSHYQEFDSFLANREIAFMLSCERIVPEKYCRVNFYD